MSGLSRRQFMLGSGAASLGLLAGCGRLPWPGSEPPARVYRLGYLGTQPSEVFVDGMRDLGYVEGQNLILEYRNPGGRTDRLDELARELVALPVDVIVATGSLPVAAAEAATSSIPIVCLGIGQDLVAGGFVPSLARPGGNITGLTSASDRLMGKRLQLLAEAVASVAQVAVLWDGNIGYPPGGDAFQLPAARLGIELRILDPHGLEELDSGLETAVRERVDALLIVGTPLSTTYRARVAAFAAQHRLPTMYDTRAVMADDGLMVYQGSTTEMARRGAAFVDKILKGANPGDLPVEQPMTFDFVVNMKTARELGITFPKEILQQVTEVIN
jgi:putative ABC transport system substrate-binding protein